jgi:hypothetical protein
MASPDSSQARGVHAGHKVLVLHTIGTRISPDVEAILSVIHKNIERVNQGIAQYHNIRIVPDEQTGEISVFPVSNMDMAQLCIDPKPDDTSRRRMDEDEVFEYRLFDSDSVVLQSVVSVNSSKTGVFSDNILILPREKGTIHYRNPVLDNTVSKLLTIYRAEQTIDVVSAQPPSSDIASSINRI